MRYYRVEIMGKTPATYTSLVGGKNDPGALNMEMDIQLGSFASPNSNNAFVRIWGISLATISQASDFNDAQIKVFAGMSAGLPLAKPLQAGLILQGRILQSFGNWIGTAMTLDLIINVDGGADRAGVPNANNIVLDWKKGQTLETALANTLKAAAPNMNQVFNISDNLVLPQDDVGTFPTFVALATHVRSVSQSIVGGDYGGVEIVARENDFEIYDGTSKSDPRMLDFVDFIGQPTWIGPNQVQFNCVMRADITIGDYIKFPLGPNGQSPQTTITQASMSQYRDKSAFQGVFIVQAIHHVGNFRQPNAESWITVFDCYTTSPAGQQEAAANG